MSPYYYSTLHGNINKYNINMLRMNGIIYYYNEEMDYCKEGGGVGIRMIKS